MALFLLLRRLGLAALFLLLVALVLLLELFQTLFSLLHHLFRKLLSAIHHHVIQAHVQAVVVDQRRLPFPLLLEHLISNMCRQIQCRQVWLNQLEIRQNRLAELCKCLAYVLAKLGTHSGNILLSGMLFQHLAARALRAHTEALRFRAQRLKARLGLDYTISNRLEIANGRLTGKVLGDIVGAEAKAAKFRTVLKELNAPKEQSVAIGDGANDLKMMAEAGLSVAFHAKPVVRAQAHCALTWSGLDGVVNLFE